MQSRYNDFKKTIRKKKDPEAELPGSFLEKNNLKVEIKHEFWGEIFVFHRQYTMK